MNGVTFAPFAIPSGGTGSVSVGNFTLGFAKSRDADNTAFGASSAPFSSLSTSYKSLLQSGVVDSDINGTGGRITLTMSGLSVGTTYTFQWWSNDSQPVLVPGSTTATSGNSVALDYNSTNAAGGVGQFAVGTFIADSSTQVITFSNSADWPVVNAFQLRAIPEPATAGMLAAGLVCLLARRRRSPRLA